MLGGNDRLELRNKGIMKWDRPIENSLLQGTREKD
jgi:hypothetical protein